MPGLKKIIIADYYGFCMGVKRAIAVTEKAAGSDTRVTIFKEIVHNEAVVEKFRSDGVGQSKTVEGVSGGTLIIPAHGASPEVFEKARQKGLAVIDATCPLVIRIHKIIDRLAADGYHILHFGDPDHDETIGIVGHAPEKVTVVASVEELNKIDVKYERMALTSQTTAYVQDFKEIEKIARHKFPHLKVYNTVCNATSQRQAAVKKLAPLVDLMLIVGSQTSANSKRLHKISKALCEDSYLINAADDIRAEWFEKPQRPVATVGLTAGASTPDFLIEGAILRLKEIAKQEVDVVYPGHRGEVNELFGVDITES